MRPSQRGRSQDRGQLSRGRDQNCINFTFSPNFLQTMKFLVDFRRDFKNFGSKWALTRGLYQTQATAFVYTLNRKYPNLSVNVAKHNTSTALQKLRGQAVRGWGHNCHKAETSNHESWGQFLSLEAKTRTSPTSLLTIHDSMHKDCRAMVWARQ